MSLEGQNKQGQKNDSGEPGSYFGQVRFCWLRVVQIGWSPALWLITLRKMTLLLGLFR
jgi:hypothetical protein